MNEIARQLRSGPKVLPTTQVCDGVPRLRWSLADFDRLIEADILTEEDRVELIQGELVPMASKGNRHELVRDEIQNWMMDHKPADVRLSSEIGWRPPDADTYVEPDILISPRRFKGANVPPQEVLLAIEVADSSLRYDTTTKARLYALLGVRDYWVVDAQSLLTRVHRQPAGSSYASVEQVPPSETLEPLLVAPLAIRLGELDLA
ncbi:MAG TPA: Uma2 family endonuclease [Hyphomicrobiaceae bacterium]|nr:Uma2 family endonuclease [Hyphomicrobiaceae bacterium]